MSVEFLNPERIPKIPLHAPYFRALSSTKFFFFKYDSAAFKRCKIYHYSFASKVLPSLSPRNQYATQTILLSVSTYFLYRFPPSDWRRLDAGTVALAIYLNFPSFS